MDRTRWIARSAAKLQLIGDAYREHAHSVAPNGHALRHEAETLDQLAAALLVGSFAPGSAA